VHFGVAELQLEGDAEELRDWLGAHDVPLAVRPGEPAVTAVVLRGPRGPLVLSGGS
jgi:hypothetical protein